VRESHFILTDVPMTLLTTLALWLTARAMRLGTVPAYAWAGALCGFAAAAKYTGGVAIAAVLAASIVGTRGARHRGVTVAAIIGAAAAAFVVGAPYTVLDMPAFLDGFAAQFARFATLPPGGDPPWVRYLKHLSGPGSRAIVPLAAVGLVVLLARSRTRARAIPVGVFALAYFYVIAAHAPVFGRYALPLLPVLSLAAAVAVLEAIALLRGVPTLRRPLPGLLAAGAIVALALWPGGSETVGWLDQFKRTDTRTLAVDWLKANAPKGTRVAVENSGPTYLEAAGLRPLGTELLFEHPPDWYRSRADFLVISNDTSRYGDYLGAGRTVFMIAPSPQRWGPAVVIVALH
jgi:hypothetical protein